MLHDYIFGIYLIGSPLALLVTYCYIVNLAENLLPPVLNSLI
jgi:hypothetical protein